MTPKFVFSADFVSATAMEDGRRRALVYFDIEMTFQLFFFPRALVLTCYAAAKIWHVLMRAI
jgi:hypothetical protein